MQRRDNRARWAGSTSLPGACPSSHAAQAFPAAVGFTDASWNPTEPAEVDATSASLSHVEMEAVRFDQGRSQRFHSSKPTWVSTNLVSTGGRPHWQSNGHRVRRIGANPPTMQSAKTCW